MIKVIGLNIKVLKKEPFSGSHQGMRFFMRAEDDTLHVWVYPEPWCFEKTSDDMKTAKDYQQEFRFLVHTQNCEKDHLELNIGDIRDISKVFKTSKILNAEVVKIK